MATPHEAEPRRAVGPSLPVIDDRPALLRADAERNRRTILDAAIRVFNGRSVEQCSVDEVVAEAGVGKGTVYRIFGDKTGLAVALLDDAERRLQSEILFGAPPLGPGAPPARRVVGFIEAYVDYVASHLTLVQMSQTSRVNARFVTGAHHFWRAHLIYLLAAAGADQPETLADVLLAAMTAEQVGYWLNECASTSDQIGAALAGLVAHAIPDS